MFNSKINNQVANIIEDIRKNGDKAVFSYVKKFDGMDLSKSGLKVSHQTIAASDKSMSLNLKRAIKSSFDNVSSYHKAEFNQIKKSWSLNKKGVQTGQFLTPIESVGIYVPGGRFSYPSTIIMTALAAKSAGVKRIAMTTPPKMMSAPVLWTAKLCGIQDIYSIGGAAAIAALAYGTETIKKVDMIVGPGNAFVNEAKRQVFGQVGIDSLAGPSEVCIIADKGCPTIYIVSDIMAQVEHDPQARAFFFCDSASKIAQVKKDLPKEAFKQVQIKQCSIAKAIEFSNEIAPEHLELLVKQPQKLYGKVKNAGAVFAGYQTPTAAGDYWAGPSHVLPTAGSAKFSSGLSVMTFLKRTSWTQVAADNMAAYIDIAQFADSEGLVWHKKSAQARFSRGCGL
ncbi:MAG: histidinol dehydrogenase [Elusimicrobiota bacterium]|jgi:histidinol dehydrogenase|nr:histidinol dehydrogenase [Elusimicrobiota bacterium]